MALPIDVILKRAQKIRLSVADLARLAEMPPCTVHRFRSRQSGNSLTLERLSSALVEEEARLLTHLQPLVDRRLNGAQQADQLDGAA